MRHRFAVDPWPAILNRAPSDLNPAMPASPALIRSSGVATNRDNTMPRPVRICRINRYPVKGLSAESLEQVVLTPGEGLPQDRRFALARASTQFDPQRPEWMHKSQFLMLMRDEKLALLRTRFDEASGRLTIECDGRPRLDATVTEASGQQAVTMYIADFMGELLPEPPQLVQAEGHRFFNAARKPGATTDKYVSIINLASVAAVAEMAGRAVDPLRFRANVHIEGVPAWAEHDWVGSEIRLGGARLRVVTPITRCAATAVDPQTAERDLDIPMILKTSFGHVHLGVYAEVVHGGSIRPGDDLHPA
jgi:uncharacterized protein